MNNLPRGVSTMANIKILTDSSVQLTPEEIEELTNTPVTLIGTGERNCDIIDLR